MYDFLKLKKCYTKTLKIAKYTREKLTKKKTYKNSAFY